jgi:hypothetical protein
MGLFKKKPDPISDRARVLSAEIATLEEQIRRLGAQMQRNDGQPRLRSTVLPESATARTPAPLPLFSDPIFEKVDHQRLEGAAGEVSSPEHYNELGVRKYDLPALLRRIQNHFRGPSTNNPRLVSYLAAGGIQGLRPLRYEKRVARNRTLALAGFLLLVILGIITFAWRR